MSFARETARLSRLLAMATAVIGLPAIALEHKPQLALATAEAIANACLAEQARAKHAPVTVVVVDDGGIPLVVKRQDAACKACVQIAELKARSASLFNLSTRTLETLSYGEKKDGVGAALPGAPHVPGIIVFPGGVPVTVNGAPIGGVGVSGASGDEDERCALAGISGARGLLK